MRLRPSRPDPRRIPQIPNGEDTTSETHLEKQFSSLSVEKAGSGREWFSATLIFRYSLFY